jgi:8-oxo-dGTP pyrophosphatase MutT (NUDIX family)
MSAPAIRQAARVLLLDGAGRVLLFRGYDPANADLGSWWFTVGGGVDEGESVRDAAARELLEETGLSLAPESFAGPLYREYAEFSIAGTDYQQDNEFYAVRVDNHDVDITGFTELETTFVVEHRWWSLEELRATTDTVYPECLADLIERLEV